MTEGRSKMGATPKVDAPPPAPDLRLGPIRFTDTAAGPKPAADFSEGAEPYRMCWEEVRNRALRIPSGKVWGVPRGGTFVVGVLVGLQGTAVYEPGDAALIVDDVVETGATRDRYARAHPGKPFAALVDKTDPAERLRGRWVRFPWESQASEDVDAEACVARLLAHVGEDPQRDGLRDTPRRVVRALREMTAGRSVDVGAVLAVRFQDRADEMVVVRGVPFWSLCEHHLLPFHGTATVGYLPDGRGVVGLSKLARVVQAFALRLQVQERMTTGIGEAIAEHLRPLGVGVIVRARHTCMGARGVRSDGEMVTSHLSGRFRDDPAVRAEFLRLDGAA